MRAQAGGKVMTALYGFSAAHRGCYIWNTLHHLSQMSPQLKTTVVRHWMKGFSFGSCNFIYLHLIHDIFELDTLQIKTSLASTWSWSLTVDLWQSRLTLQFRSRFVCSHFDLNQGRHKHTKQQTQNEAIFTLIQQALHMWTGITWQAAIE